MLIGLGYIVHIGFMMYLFYYEVFLLHILLCGIYFCIFACVPLRLPVLPSMAVSCAVFVLAQR